MPSTESEETLAADVPVLMPTLPTRLTVNTVQQFKALGDMTRSRILGIIQLQPATAKQIADRLGIAPGTIGHHLQVLEDAGLAQIVARRLVHGIVAKYYTRTARIFAYDFPSDVSDHASAALQIHTKARDELAETVSVADNNNCSAAFPETRSKVAFPHARLSAERAEEYSKRIFAIVDDLLQEQPNPDGQIYGFYSAFFVAPPYLQAGDEQAHISSEDK
ncbi:MAG: hypothetical protein NVSMB38_40830 [Ktedonobacteraceae bacterium]